MDSNKKSDNLIKKSRIRTITALQNEEFKRVVQNSFSDEKQSDNSYTNFDKGSNNINSMIGWQL